MRLFVPILPLARKTGYRVALMDFLLREAE
jgi:hypothetical protein